MPSREENNKHVFPHFVSKPTKSPGRLIQNRKYMISYLIYTHQIMHLYIILKKFKIYIKTLLHVSIIRSFSGSTYCSLLKLYIKTISDVLLYINFGDVYRH